MNHAIEQQIKDNTLYVEVEPQPLPGSIFSKNEAHLLNLSKISIGDTVCQGEEWGYLPGGGNDYMLKKDWLAPDAEWEPPQTMPIELADKTFKVVGIEVEGESIIIKKWFWKYSLEEL